MDNIFTLLATAFGLNAATSEAGLTANGMETALAGQATITPDGTAPKAYLNYIFLDKNFDPDSDHTMGFERLPSRALNNYQLLEKEIPIKKEGFLYIYVANESPYDQDVWFDDFKVEVTKSPVAAVSDYYPFGMLQAGNSTNGGDPLGNKYLYQGKEIQNELGLEIYDFEARYYDPTIGRTFQIDPHAENYLRLSPYSWTGNNPIINVDPTGKDWYASRETGALEYHDGETGYLEGYDYVAEAGASTDAIRSAYDFVNSQGSYSLLNDVTVTPSLFENLETIGENISNLSLSDIENAIESPLNDFGGWMEENLGPKIDQFRDNLESVELGLTGRIGVKSANITLSTGLFSTDPNTGGFFLSVRGNLDVNNISISEFKSLDFGSEAYMGLNLNKTQSLTTKGSISSGTIGYSSYSDGRHRLGIGLSKPGRFTMKGGLWQQNNIYNFRTEEIGL